MQISPSTNLFRALGNLPQTQQASRSPAGNSQPATAGAQQRSATPATPMQVVSALPETKPAANLPRGSLINLKV